MSNKNVFLSDSMWEYMQRAWMREPDLLRRLREETETMENAGFQISPDQGQLMTLLVKLSGAKRALEVGVFTGYSSICTMLGMPPDGTLVACDISEKYTSVARRYWDESGLSDRVRLIVGPAVESLQGLIDGGQAGTFDVAFIDADKPSYPIYVEQTLTLLRPGGVMMIDNVFRDGTVADESLQDEGVNNIRRLNAKLHDDERIDLAVIPIADGITIAIKR